MGSLGALSTGTWLVLGVLLTDLYAAVRILRAACAPATKAGWLALVFLVPVVGVVVWMVFGPS